MKHFFLLIVVAFTYSIHAQTIEVLPSKPVTIDYQVTGSLDKKLILQVNNPGDYAGLSILEDNRLLIDDINLPNKGEQVVTAIVNFYKQGDVQIQFRALDEKLTIYSYRFEDINEIDIPVYKDISEQAGLDKVSSLKYAGPSIADIDNDGDYDFIVNNHNAETSKLYWNNGDGTVTKHDKDLSRWFKHDLHGTSLGDYDNDGDLDLVLEQGGGNGTNPSTANFYLNDHNTFVLFTGDVGIDKGGRGRGSKWMDMDLDGNLDLLLYNESTLNFDKPQHFFYENNGDGTFTYRSVKGIEDVEQSRVLVTDFNNDNIDDLIFFSPLTLWKGNGGFTFTEVTTLIPENIRSLRYINAVTDIDIDNDGDLDLYLARGMRFEHGKGETPFLDFDPITKELAIKTRGYKGTDAFEFNSEGKIKLHKYYYLAQGSLLGKDYPIFLGKNKTSKIVKSDEELEIKPEEAKGWPNDISENGFYLGYIGNSMWKGILVRDDNFFWQYRFSLSGVNQVNPQFIPQNRNHFDVLLRNDGTGFKDVSNEWNIPLGGNAMGVTTGDFNNDSHQDLFVYRWGRIGGRVSDLMLLNTGNSSFEITTMHGANDVGAPGNGDMGQAFDFDLDGKIDLLNGSEGGEWYLFSNTTNTENNYVLVRVGYAPKSNVDPISAEVIVNTTDNEYRKRVGSAGEVFSQSLLNIVHFGIGKESKIKSIRIRWRNGEIVAFKNKSANVIYDTDKLDPESLSFEPTTIRKGTKTPLSLSVIPQNVNKDVIWSSSNEKIVSVDENGVVSALGKPDKSAIIKVTSKANGLSTNRKIKIIECTPKPVTSISLRAPKTKLYTGQSTVVLATVLPNNADNPELIWSSDNTDILTVENNGTVHAIAPGKTTVRVSTKDSSVTSEIEFNIETFVAPYIKITNKAQYKNKALIVNDVIKVRVNYHAGSGNRVISADEGGIRFWLRHFKNKWIPIKDVVHVYKEALNTESGTAETTFSLKGYIPSEALPKGQFYQIRVTFTSSDGTMYEDDILPLQIEIE
ncbi:CRTAC1 family protein [Aureibaculum marinum]|uniref:CRTAC1 family protein n=1 Tax=Aureibaculum marinum TaxID=2487930 RepID=A0A3N4P3F6_9FLAO|nr:FG-GAP-like repeat-containing protein [Aureibaculum marinum]RPD99110.1 CRTAC1 family protein [Aureibaculum marinum]